MLPSEARRDARPTLPWSAAAHAPGTGRPRPAHRAAPGRDCQRLLRAYRARDHGRRLHPAAARYRGSGGHGIRGVFVAEQYFSGGRVGVGYWAGSFRASNHRLVVAHADYNEQPSALRAGSEVPALYPGGSEVFAPHDSSAWLDDVFFMLVGAAFLAGGSGTCRSGRCAAADGCASKLQRPARRSSPDQEARLALGSPKAVTQGAMSHIYGCHRSHPRL